MKVENLRAILSTFPDNAQVYFEPYDDLLEDYDSESVEEIAHVIRYEGDETVYLRPRNPREYAKKNREET